MKRLSAFPCIFVLAVAFTSLTGCGSDNGEASSVEVDEISAYVEAHPELKEDVLEDLDNQPTDE